MLKKLSSHQKHACELLGAGVRECEEIRQVFFILRS